ncbi:MAG: VWA domain-containing protein [Planctomycetota bacterium]|nr:MAG: VWA domain-containing protein [Planctomycetota bacterium]
MALLLILALCVYTAGRESQGILLTAHTDNSDSAALLDLTPQFELQPEAAPAEPLEPEVDAGEIAIDVDIELPDPGEGLNDPIGSQLTSITAADVVATLKPSGNRRGASFFGTYAAGNRFVYVLDSSRSMLGDRWVYACNQLLDSLNGLEESQEFVVICFDMHTTFMFNKSPADVAFLHPTPPIVARIRRWLRSIELGRATMPAEAMQYALQLNPDAIFMLSDGELQDNTVNLLRMLNSPRSERRQIPIHTVHLFSLQGRRTLQLIAMENGGTFTPVEQQRGFRQFPVR